MKKKISNNLKQNIVCLKCAAYLSAQSCSLTTPTLNFRHNFALRIRIVVRYLKHLPLGHDVAITRSPNDNATKGLNRTHIRKLLMSTTKFLQSCLFN